MNQCVQTKDLSGFIRKANNVVEFFPPRGLKWNRVMRGGNLNLDIGVLRAAFRNRRKRGTKLRSLFLIQSIGEKLFYAPYPEDY